MHKKTKKGMQLLTCLLSISILVSVIIGFPMHGRAQIELKSPSVILIERSTGTVIYEKNADEQRSPASITKIMTLLLTLEQIHAGKANLKDEVLVSERAASMGGSQVYLAQGEVQTLDTMIKCIAVASGNDASVAVAEHIAGSEEAFVKMMNDKAASLGMTETHFIDCCGLADSDEHHTSARDVAIMSRELITEYPEIYDYTKIWMEDVTHVTNKGSSIFTLSSTNKLLKRYSYCTGLKTGSTQKAKYCISATASKDGIDLIAVVLGAPDPKARFSEAQTLLTYGYASCRLFVDREPPEVHSIPIKNALENEIGIELDGEFSYLDLENIPFDEIKKHIELPDAAQAPVRRGEIAGYVVYEHRGAELGRVPIRYQASADRATFETYLRYAIQSFLFQ